MELSMSIFQTVEAALIAAGQKIESVLEPKALALWNIGKSGCVATFGVAGWRRERIAK
jgi:hypothetical protein